MWQWAVRVLLVLTFAYVASGASMELELQRLRSAPRGKAEPVEYEGLEFENPQERRIYTLEGDRESRYPWTPGVEGWQCLVLLSLAGGLFGGVLRDGWETYNKRVGTKNYLFGLPMGAALLGVSAGFRLLMLEGDGDFRPISVVVVAGLGGCFVEPAWAFLDEQARKFFKP